MLSINVLYTYNMIYCLMYGHVWRSTNNLRLWPLPFCFDLKWVLLFLAGAFCLSCLKVFMDSPVFGLHLM